MTNVLYIYGYGSHADNNRTAGLLTKYLDSRKYNVLCFDYNQLDCTEALTTLKDIIRANNINLVIGSSLGGFLALNIPNIPRIVMNPCLKPSVELPEIGCPVNVANTYAPYEEAIVNLAEPSMTMGFFSVNDELLGTKYVDFFKLNGFGNPIMFDTPHRVSEDAIRDVVAPNIDLIWSKVANYRNFLSEVDNNPIFD